MTTAYVRKIDVEIAELAKPEYQPIRQRAFERIEQSILDLPVDSSQILKPEIEIPSFPSAVVMLAATGIQKLKTRFALSEAKRVTEYLREEKIGKVVEIAKFFKWDIKIKETEIKVECEIHFSDYLRNISTLYYEKKWKLVNRVVNNGKVFLPKNDVARLLEEEVRRYIEQKLNININKLPPEIEEYITKLRQLIPKGQYDEVKLPKEVATEAFPPCIQMLYEKAVKGQHIPHIGRFTLTAFLVTVGMGVEAVIQLYKKTSDYKERMTRYQVEHIAGVRGSRTKYIPPICETLRTHGVCNSECKGVKSPFGYYYKNIGSIKTKKPS